jgi:predicted aminopeptidase
VARLRLVRDAKVFAIEELGLARTDSYSSVYDTEGGPVAWNLSACADDSFSAYRWDFPILGSLPYKGYFRVEPAIEEARGLRSRGMDVLLYAPEAYSTLGWLADPVFTPMLEEDDEVLVNTILHELTHATIFIEKDADFNETLATFVGGEGALEYFRARGGASDPRLGRAADSEHDDRIFAAAVAALKAELGALYSMKAGRAETLRAKTEIFTRFRERYRTEIRPKLAGKGIARELRSDLNNAWVLAVDRYHGDLEVFARLHTKLGSRLPATIAKLKEIAAAAAPRAALEASVDGRF